MSHTPCPVMPASPLADVAPIGVTGSSHFRDHRTWASAVQRSFFPFSLRSQQDEGFTARSNFRQSPGLAVGEVHADAHVATISRDQRDAIDSGMTKVFWMLEGDADFEQGDQAWHVGAGQWVAYDVDKPYRFQSTARTSFITVVCMRRLLGLSSEVFARPTPRLTTDVSLMARQLIRTTLRSKAPLGQRAVDVLAYGLQQSILEGLSQREPAAATPGVAPQLVADAKRRILLGLGDPDLRADTLAAALRVSRRTLYSAFATLSETPARAILDARLERARQLLSAQASVTRNLTELAMSVGFNDAAHFSRSYRAKFGETPSSTRKRRG